MSSSPTPGPDPSDVAEVARDIADVPAVQVITAAAVHLMSAAAVKCGLAEEGDDLRDLDEARKLITALAALITASAAANVSRITPKRHPRSTSAAARASFPGSIPTA